MTRHPPAKRGAEQVVDVIPLLTRHKTEVLLDAGLSRKAVAAQAQVSLATVRRVKLEADVVELTIDLAEAIVDRILERGRLLRLDGPSVRTKHLPTDERAGDDQGVRVSGKGGSEFLELASAGDRRAHLGSHLLGVNRCAREWSKALGQFAVFFEGRLPVHLTHTKPSTPTG